MNLMTARRSKRSKWVFALSTGALLIAALIPAVATAVAPNKPGDLVVSRGAQQPVIASLTWTAPENTDVDFYRVVAATSPSGPFTSVAVVEGTRFDFVDGLGGMEYYFLVSAIDVDGRESGAAEGGPVSASWADSPHERSELGGARCLTCHSVHAAGTTTLLRQELSSDIRDAQCTACHDGRVVNAANVASGTVDSFGQRSGHGFGGTGAMPIEGCSTCHNTHGTKQDARMLPAKTINGKEVAAAGIQQCTACHDAEDSWVGGEYAETSAPERDTAGYPVSGTWTGPDTYASAINLHRLIPESTQTVEASDPVRRDQGDCRYCHTAHGAANEYDGLRATFTVPTASTLASDQAEGTSAALCYTCHGGTAPNGFTAAPGTDIKQFSTADATSSAGHTIVTDGGTLPVGSPLPCFECHNPHGSKRGNTAQISDERGAGLSTDSAGGVRAFCFTCHSTSDTAAGWDSVAAEYAPVAANAKIVGLPRDGALLRLPDGSAHEQGDGRSCYECHGDNYDTNGRNVHNPASTPAELEVAEASQSNAATADPSGVTTGTAVDAITIPDFGAVDATSSVGGSATVDPPAAQETSTTLLGQIGDAIVDLFSVTP